MKRIYLDWNATTPVRPEARAAMISAMDLVGNPSSVHGEGRAAKSLIEKARGQIASAFGADNADVVFTSSATEAAALALTGRELHCSDVEHEAVSSWCDGSLGADHNGVVKVGTPSQSVLQTANSETGVLQALPEGLFLTDATQSFGKMPFAFNWCGADMAIISAHKLGGPKGIGALVLKQGLDVTAQIRGGGQEMGRRSGTENVIGIAGFGAAAQAAQLDLDAGVWRQVEKLRNILENLLEESLKEINFVGKDADRLPNTSCFAVPGWKGETQVMQMDLAGFAVSAGSACSSGKVKSSRVLRAMGFKDDVAACAMRVSLGPTTQESEIRDFAAAYIKAYQRHKARAA
ncbi:MAG: cysteine desulfurase family protein [Pseudoruegeria sp.]